jgi:hypothetical protein
VDGDNTVDLKQIDGGLLEVKLNGSELSSKWLISDSSSGKDYPVTAGDKKLVVDAGGSLSFDLPWDSRLVLDTSAVDETIVGVFKDNGIELSRQANVTGNGLQVSDSLMTDLARGVVPGGLNAALATRDVTLSSAAKVESLVIVKIDSAGSLWVVQDDDATLAYRISVASGDKGKLSVAYYNTSMPLHVTPDEKKVTYLDMGTEMKGYIYVLSYINDGKQVSDYRLDLYDPYGRWLSRTPDTSIEPKATGVNAAKLIVDMWRTMFTLNFEHFEGPGGRTEPSVGRWLPTTPKS